ncbi:MAG: fructosamine kinase family protein [Bacteroidota bacterium]
MASTGLQSRLKAFFSHSIDSISSVSGGDISEAYLVKLSNSQKYFVKFNSSDFASNMFQKEKNGIITIASSDTISVPNVVGVESFEQGAFLVLEHIETTSSSTKTLTHFGQELAAMHNYQNNAFGLDSDNYIGSLEQFNTRSKDWISFYAKERLQKQFDLALFKGLLSKDEIPELKDSIEILSSLIPTEQASLLHGDLWNGNFLTGTNGSTYLIDPAVYYGDRIVDIAMSQLFGGFGKDFYESYFHWSPKIHNFQERIDLYQLYYLLVHLNLFGCSYYSSVKQILQCYF